MKKDLQYIYLCIYWVYIYILIIYTMFKIIKLENREFILQKDDISVKTIFNEWKVWLTIHEIWKLFSMEKWVITENIKNIFLSNGYDIENDIEKVYNKSLNKKETYYSLDVIISLWYRFRSYKNTKFIINSNKIIKENMFLKNKTGESIWSKFSRNLVNLFNIIKKDFNIS